MRKKRFISFILSLALTVSSFASAPLGGVKAKADPADEPEIIYVDSYEDLKTALESDGDANIMLTDDIEETIGNVEQWDDDGLLIFGTILADTFTLGLTEIILHDCRSPSYCGPDIDTLITMGSGKKSLILDGNDINICYPNINQLKSTLLSIPSNADLTIIDETNDGEIFYDGYIPDSSDWDKFKAPLNRDVINVYGNLTINGGTIKAGRSKLESGFCIFNAVNLDNEVYTGSATRLLCGTAINVYSGNVTVNKGKLVGRGFEKMSSYAYAEEKNAVVEIHSGSVTLNDAYVYAQSSADCFNRGYGDALKIYSGKFELHRNDALFYGSWGEIGYQIDDSPDYGCFNIPQNACENWNRVQVDYYYKEKSGNCPGSNSKWRDYAKEYIENKSKVSDYDPSVVIYPRNLDFILDSDAYPGTYPVYVDPSLTGRNELFFHAYDREWSFDYIPYYVRNTGGWTSTMTYTLYDENGKTLKLIDNKVTYGNKEGNGFIEFNLEDHMDTSLLEYGKTYYLACELIEKYNGSRKYTVESLGSIAFIPTHKDAPTVLSIDDKVIADTKGEKVTLHASAENASSAYWEKRSYNEGSSILPCTSFEYVDGIAYATLEVEPTCYSYYHCYFTNNVGTTASMGTFVDYVPSFIKTKDETLTLYDGMDLTISQPIDHTIDEMEGSSQIIKVEWWFKKVGGTSFKKVSSYINSNGVGEEVRGTNLLIAGGKEYQAGEYYAKVYNKSDPEGLVRTSPIVTVNYINDEPIGHYIEQPEIYGIGDLCIGDKAPTVEDLYTPDPRFEIRSITWYGLDINGYISSAYPTYTIELASKSVPTYMFRYDSNGTMKWTMDGSLRTDYGYANKTDAGVNLTFSYNTFNYVTTPTDKVSFDKTTFSMEKGETVDIPLDITVETNVRFTRLGETHTMTSLVLTHESGLPLPEGLSLVRESNGYHIKGTVTENAGAIQVPLTVNLSNGSQWGQTLYFYILPDPSEAAAQQEEINDSLHVYHNFNGDWLDAGDGTHIQGCSDCGEFRVEEHMWGDGEIITEATEESEGTVLYTCTVCGAEKIESITYDAKKCTITFDPNDGVNKAVTLTTGAGVVMTLPENPFAGNGKAFDGWSAGQPGEKIVVNDNLYINACWNDGKITVNRQPKDIIAKTGNTAKFTFAVTSNYTLTYQWQVSTDNGLTWKNSSMSGNKTKTLSVGATAARSNYLFRCVVSDRNGNCITSKPARLLATTSKPAIVVQPEDQASAPGDTAYFTVTAGNYDGTSVSYQWQASTDGGATWKNSGLKGNKTDTLNVAVTEARAGYKFRCVVTSGTKKVTSKSAKLIVVKDAIAVSTQPSDVTASENASVKFSVNASSTTDSALTYQWQVSTDGGKNWNNSGLTGNKTKVLTVKATAARDGYLFRCKITDANGMKVTSSKVKLTVVSEVIKISKQPANLAKAAGTTAKFTVKAESTQGYTLSYQWQALKPGGEWKNSGLKGNKTATLSVDATDARNGYKFRCVITDSKGNQVISGDAELTVTAPVQ